MPSGLLGDIEEEVVVVVVCTGNLNVWLEWGTGP